MAAQSRSAAGAMTALTSSATGDSAPIVIVGGGFGGLACARQLGAAGVPTVLIDRQNYHLFVPLLYQVATAALSPADIAQPIRRILSRYPTVSVVLGEVVGVDAATKRVLLAGQAPLAYGRLILAAGSVCNYFGHDSWAEYAPCPRDLPDATLLRSRILLALEAAEASTNSRERAALLSFVVVGGGPTGVEMAGAIAELIRPALRRDFRSIDPGIARIVLVEAGPRLLSAFPEDLAQAAARGLQRLRVEIRTGISVREISASGVDLADGARIDAATVVWGAGTRAAPAADWLPGIETAPGGRLLVEPDLRLRSHDDIYVLGDLALCLGKDGKPLPALAQVAKQQGEYLGRVLSKPLAPEQAAAPFIFRNRGNAAIIGRNAAIFDFGKGRTLTGRIAWLLWALVHIYLLNGLERRFLVAAQWLVRYVTRQRGARLITARRLPEAGPRID
ncbi:NADH dehydrogenase [Bosea sp. OAE506]|uniref:NAD(P)/FAD-dependent oxidoreductase n=1 Tax=Bosea sp. OAE506 TaxID=2663870 RepID=UPI001A08B688